MTSDSAVTAFRGHIMHCVSDPGDSDDSAALEYFDDGLLVVKQGRVAACGPAAQLLSTLPEGLRPVDHRDQLIIPGLIDCHVHYPQTDMIACYGAQLLDWLTNFTFPVEQDFDDPRHARQVADFFLDELLRNRAIDKRIQENLLIFRSSWTERKSLPTMLIGKFIIRGPADDDTELVKVFTEKLGLKPLAP